MRKIMTKEVTKTTVKVAKMVVDENNLPKAEPLEDVILIGNVSPEKAQKTIDKMFDEKVMVFGVEVNTEVYEMEVEEFIKHARLRTPNENNA